MCRWRCFITLEYVQINKAREKEKRGNGVCERELIERKTSEQLKLTEKLKDGGNGRERERQIKGNAWQMDVGEGWMDELEKREGTEAEMEENKGRDRKTHVKQIEPLREKKER